MSTVLIDPPGDLIELDEFLEMVKMVAFIDYDGMGSWATAEAYLDGADNWIYPSKIISGEQKPPVWATHVLWYNR